MSKTIPWSMSRPAVALRGRRAGRRRGLARGRGSTMIEVLVSLAILGFGLTGLASLQTLGLRANYDAYLRSQAGILVHDMFDRLVVRCRNVDQPCIDAYAIAVGDAPALSDPVDLRTWMSKVAASLPGGDAEIAINGRIVTIRVFWFERQLEDGSLAGSKRVFVAQSDILES